MRTSVFFFLSQNREASWNAVKPALSQSGSFFTRRPWVSLGTRWEVLGFDSPVFQFLCARLRTTFRRAQPRIASVLRHRRGSTTIHQRPGQ